MAKGKFHGVIAPITPTGCIERSNKLRKKEINNKTLSTTFMLHLCLSINHHKEFFFLNNIIETKF